MTSDAAIEPADDAAIEPADASIESSDSSLGPDALSSEIPAFEPVPPLPPTDSGTTIGWEELVDRHHGERKAVVEPGLGPLSLEGTAEAVASAGGTTELEPAAEPVHGNAVGPEGEAGDLPDSTAARAEANAVPAEVSAISADAIERLDRRIDRLQDEILGSVSALRDHLDGVAGELRPKVGEIESELESSIAVLFEQIGRIDDKLASTESGVHEQVSALRRQVAALETGFEGALDRLNQGSAQQLESTPADAPAWDPADDSRVQLNSATFEDLRRIGLSVTQAARVIAYRDTHGGFAEIGQLREVRGLSREDLQLLTDRASL